jgi:CBS-domain-containing membrane protein
MSSPVVTFFPEQTLGLADDVMHLRHLRHIPVIDDERHVVGLVSHRICCAPSSARWGSPRRMSPARRCARWCARS